MQVCRDALLVACAFHMAYTCRFSLPNFLPYGQVSSTHETLAIGLMLVVVWPAVGWLGGLYTSRRAHNFVSEVFDVVKTTAIAFLVLVTLTYFVRDVRYSRAVLILWGVFNMLLLAGSRGLSMAALRRMRAHGYNLRHVLVVGSGDLGERVVQTLTAQAALGMRVCGVIIDDEDIDSGITSVAQVPVIGTVSQLSQRLTQRHIDQVIVALPIHKLGALRGIMDVLSKETVDVRLIPDFYQYMTLCGSIEELSGLPIINLQSTPLLGWNLALKRSFDVIFASLGLVLIAPLMGLIALWVRLSSPGPIFYLQERVGMDGACFQMVKFRTMHLDAEDRGAQMTAADDPRRTAVGTLLRRLSLDELPQLWNVLRGDMSLVGPRPERPCFIENFKQEIPRYALRHKIKAGMTGWAQVNGLRGNTSIAKRIELDLYYIENWSLLLDLKIVLRTILGGFLSPHAY